MSRLDKIVVAVVLLWLAVAWTALLVWGSRRERQREQARADSSPLLLSIPQALPQDYCPTGLGYGNSIHLCRSGHKAVEVTDPGGDWSREQ